MFNRFCFGTLLLACLALPFTGCNNTSSGLDSIQVTPATNSIAAGATVQLTATGKFGNGSHPTYQDVTSQASWSSASTGIAIVGPCTSGGLRLSNRRLGGRRGVGRRQRYNDNYSQRARLQRSCLQQRIRYGYKRNGSNGSNGSGSDVGNMQCFRASGSCDSCLETATRRGDRRS